MGKETKDQTGAAGSGYRIPLLFPLWETASVRFDVLRQVRSKAVMCAEKVHVRVWERRSASRGGQYFFVVREGDVFPIEKLGAVEEREERGRRAFFIEATLQPDDLVVQIDFSISGSIDIHCCKAKEMNPDKLGLYNTNGQRADRALLTKLAENPNLPKWLRKRLPETLW